MTEQQASHRRTLEAAVVQASIKREAQGQWSALVITAAAMLCGVWLIDRGRDIQGFVLILGELATLAGIFSLGEEKAEPRACRQAWGAA